MDKKALPLNGLVKKAIKDLGGRKHIKEEEIFNAWEEAAGNKASRHSSPVSFKSGLLVVNVDASAWLYELTLNKKEILEKLAGRLKGKKIKDIRFRIGEAAKRKEDERENERP